MFDFKIVDDFSATTVILERTYYYKTKDHRQYGPAGIGWNTNGAIIRKKWLTNNRFTRTGNPAFMTWFPTGRPRCETWCLDGQLHRNGGPAYLEWDDNGTLISQCYWVYGIILSNVIKEWAIATGIVNVMDMTEEEMTLFKLTWGK